MSSQMVPSSPQFKVTSFYSSTKECKMDRYEPLPVSFQQTTHRNDRSNNIRIYDGRERNRSSPYSGQNGVGKFISRDFEFSSNRRSPSFHRKRRNLSPDYINDGHHHHQFDNNSNGYERRRRGGRRDGRERRERGSNFSDFTFHQRRRDFDDTDIIHHDYDNDMEEDDDQRRIKRKRERRRRNGGKYLSSCSKNKEMKKNKKKLRDDDLGHYEGKKGDLIGRIPPPKIKKSSSLKNMNGHEKEEEEEEKFQCKISLYFSCLLNLKIDEIVKRIGKGTFGKVFKVKSLLELENQKNNEEEVVKKMDDERSSFYAVKVFVFFGFEKSLLYLCFLIVFR